MMKSKLKYRFEKHDHENFLKSLKIHKKYCKKKYNNLNKKKVILIITEIPVDSASTIGRSTVGLVIPGAGIILLFQVVLLG